MVGHTLKKLSAQTEGDTAHRRHVSRFISIILCIARSKAVIQALIMLMFDVCSMLCLHFKGNLSLSLHNRIIVAKKNVYPDNTS